MKRIFLDTNILLDDILNREGLAEYAEIILQLNSLPEYEVCASFLTFANIAYIIRKKDKEERYNFLREYSNCMNVLPMNNAQLQIAINNPVKDFEDMLQYQCALENQCDVIVTNNTNDFKEFCKLPLFTSEEFLLNL